MMDSRYELLNKIHKIKIERNLNKIKQSIQNMYYCDHTMTYHKISELCDEYGFDFNLSYNNSMNLSITPRLTINKITTNITIKTDNN